MRIRTIAICGLLAVTAPALAGAGRFTQLFCLEPGAPSTPASAIESAYLSELTSLTGENFASTMACTQLPANDPQRPSTPTGTCYRCNFDSVGTHTPEGLYSEHYRLGMLHALNDDTDVIEIPDLDLLSYLSADPIVPEPSCSTPLSTPLNYPRICLSPQETRFSFLGQGIYLALTATQLRVAVSLDQTDRWFGIGIGNDEAWADSIIHAGGFTSDYSFALPHIFTMGTPVVMDTANGGSFDFIPIFDSVIGGEQVFELLRSLVTGDPHDLALSFDQVKLHLSVAVNDDGTETLDDHGTNNRRVTEIYFQRVPSADAELAWCASGTATDCFVEAFAPALGAGRLDGLAADKQASALVLSWPASCAASDTGASVYSGTLGSFYSHGVRECSNTGGSWSEPLAGRSLYYLVVPGNAEVEGSYGRDGSASERPIGSGACLPQQFAANCP